MAFPDRLDLTIYTDLRDSENVVDLSGSVSDYLRNTSFTFPSTTKFTIEQWIETDDTGYAGALFCFATSGDVDHVLVKDYRDLEITVNGVSSGATGIAINDGAAHHVALTWQSSDGAAVLYIDGKQRWSGTLATSALTASGALVLGQEVSTYPSTYASGSTFKGRMYDVRIWSAVRTESEIFDDMKLRQSPPVTDLANYWKIDEGTGTTAADSAGSADLTLSSAGLWTTTETPFFTDVTAYVEPESLQLNGSLGETVDTCYFTIESWSGTEPQEWDEIVVIDGSTRIFGGFVTSINRSEGEGATVKHALGCSDYGIYLDHVIHKAEWLSKTDREIIVELIQTYAPWIGTDNITSLKSYDTYRMNRKTVRRTISDLAKNAQASWYVSPDRELYFFYSSTATAPFDLSDSPDLSTTYPFFGLTKHEGGSDIANVIEVIGGTYLSTDQTIYVAGTGQDNRVIMPFKMHGPSSGGEIQVWRNDGTEATPSWTAMTVKTGNLETLSGPNDVLHYYQDKVLEQQNNWPNLPNAVKIYGRYDVPLRTRVRDYASFDYYKKWFYDYISDATIVDKATSRLVAKGELAERSMGKTTLTLHTVQPGLRAGQKIHVTSAQFGIDGDFVIHRVKASVYAYGRVRYGLSLGVWNDDLIDILLELWNSRRVEPDWRDEVLDELINVSEIVEAVETTYTPSTTAPPYDWAVTTGTPLIWDFGAWG